MLGQPAFERDSALEAAERARDEEARGRNAARLAGAHPLLQDPLGTFEEARHVYHLFGQRVAISVTGLKGRCLDKFDPDKVLRECFPHWVRTPSNEHHAIVRRVLDRGGSEDEAREAVRREWATAGEFGTAMHLAIELISDGERVEEETDERFKDVRAEMRQFRAWARRVGFWGGAPDSQDERTRVWDALQGLAEAVGQAPVEAPDAEPPPLPQLIFPHRTELSVFIAHLDCESERAAAPGQPHDFSNPAHLPFCAGQIDFLGTFVRPEWGLVGLDETARLRPELRALRAADAGALLRLAPDPNPQGVLWVCPPGSRWAAGHWDADARGVVRYPEAPWLERALRDLGAREGLGDAPGAARAPEEAERWVDGAAEGALLGLLGPRGPGALRILRVCEATGAVELELPAAPGAGSEPLDGAERVLRFQCPIAKQFVLDDWKRIKPKKDVRAGARAYADRRCKPPLSTYPQNDHTQFSIQLSLYREMLARGTGIELSSMERLGPDGLPAGPSCIVRMHRDLSPGPRGVPEAEQVPVRHMGLEARTLLQMELEQRLREREEQAEQGAQSREGAQVLSEGALGRKKRKLVMDPLTGRFADARATM
jgi:hypothetical protein